MRYETLTRLQSNIVIWNDWENGMRTFDNV